MPPPWVSASKIGIGNPMFCWTRRYLKAIGKAMSLWPRRSEPSGTAYTGPSNWWQPSAKFTTKPLMLLMILYNSPAQLVLYCKHHSWQWRRMWIIFSMKITMLGKLFWWWRWAKVEIQGFCRIIPRWRNVTKDNLADTSHNKVVVVHSGPADETDTV